MREDEEHIKKYGALSDKPLPSGIGKLPYITGGNIELGYARRFLHVMNGEYVPRENIIFDTKDLSYKIIPFK